MNCVGQDTWPLWSEIYRALPLETKILEVLFAFDKNQLSGINTTEENKENMCPVWHADFHGFI